MKLKGHPERQHISNVKGRILEVAEEALLAVEELKTDATRAGNAKHALEKARSLALPKYVGEAKNQTTRDALAFKDFENEHLEYELADNLKTASVEKVRTLRQVLSALQTICNADRQVNEMLQFGQDPTP